MVNTAASAAAADANDDAAYTAVALNLSNGKIAIFLLSLDRFLAILENFSRYVLYQDLFEKIFVNFIHFWKGIRDSKSIRYEARNNEMNLLISFVYIYTELWETINNVCIIFIIIKTYEKLIVE